MIPDEAVTAAARGMLAASTWGDEWGDISDLHRGWWLAQATSALESAYPIMLSHEREEARLAHVDAVVNAETADRLERELAEAKASALEEAADNWSDWDALEAPEAWLRSRANIYRSLT